MISMARRCRAWGDVRYTVVLELQQRLEGAGLDPAHLDPWEAWKVFKQWLCVPVPGVEYDAASVQTYKASEAGDAATMFLVRQFTCREGPTDRLIGRVVVEFEYAPEMHADLPETAVWTHDFPSLAEFAAVVEAQVPFQHACNARPTASDVYWDEDDDDADEP